MNFVCILRVAFKFCKTVMVNDLELLKKLKNILDRNFYQSSVGMRIVSKIKSRFISITTTSVTQGNTSRGLNEYHEKSEYCHYAHEQFLK